MQKRLLLTRLLNALIQQMVVGVVKKNIDPVMQMRVMQNHPENTC
jgi:hypothetical protein